MDKTKFKIVVDSSADTYEWDGIPFASAPLKIITDNKEYIDDSKMNVEEMVNELSVYSGKSSTACPSPIDWLKAFGKTQYIFCITITSGLSGSYNSALIAKNDYEENHPDCRVCVIDSLSTGPEMRLLIEKINEYVDSGFDFDEIVQKIGEYKQKTALIFMLESMRNLANNGRVSKIAAKTAGILGIRAVGIASQEGTLQLMDKSRGEKRALAAIIDIIKKSNFKKGKIRIGHCLNKAVAEKLRDLIFGEFGQQDIEIYPLGGLCSFYAEKGGLIIGYEKI